MAWPKGVKRSELAGGKLPEVNGRGKAPKAEPVPAEAAIPKIKNVNVNVLSALEGPLGEIKVTIKRLDLIRKELEAAYKAATKRPRGRPAEPRI